MAIAELGTAIPRQEEAAQKHQSGEIKSRILRFFVSEGTIVTVLLINTAVFMSVALDPQIIAKYGHWIEHVDVACVLYFVFEASVKLSVLGPRNYFRSRWNIFDFAIVIASLPVLVAAFVNLPENLFAVVMTLRFARFLRVLRMIRYVNAVPAMTRLRTPIFSLIGVVSVKAFVLESTLFPTIAMEWLEKGYLFFIVLTICWILAGLYNIFDDVHLQPMSLGTNPKLDGLLLSFLRILVNIFFIATGSIIGLKNAGYDPWTIVAGIGIGGMAVAFAAQETIANVISGVLLFLQRPFLVGERIEIAGVIGKVQSIGLRTVTIRRMTGEAVIIPNKNFTSSVLQNIDARASYMTRLPVPISSRTPANKVAEALKILDEIATTAPMLEKVHYANFDKIPGDGSYVLDLWIKTKKWKPEEKDALPDDWTKIYYGPTYCLTEIVRRFNEAGIEFAHPPAPIINVTPSFIGTQQDGNRPSS